MQAYGYGPDMVALAKGLKLLNLNGCDSKKIGKLIRKVKRLLQVCACRTMPLDLGIPCVVLISIHNTQ